jgi:hypothetical protein
MLYELKNTLGGILDHSSKHNLSRSLISFCCTYGLPSSIQTTGSQWDSNPETEMAIAKGLFHNKNNIKIAYNTTWYYNSFFANLYQGIQ